MEPFSISPIVDKNVLAAHQYNSICLGPNIEKHAQEPLYPPNKNNPHNDYSHIPQLKITKLDKELSRLKDKIERKYETVRQGKEHWLDYVKVKDLDNTNYHCPNKIGYEKILDLDNPDQKKEVMMYNVCKHTIFAAAKRQMKKAPKPDPQITDDFINFSKKWIEKYIGEELNNFGYSFAQWYEHNNAAKQHDIDAYLKYLENSSIYTEKEKQQFETLDYEGICKVELQPIDGKPRMVCSIPIKTKVTMGPVTWKLEEIMEQHMPGYCGSKNLKEMTDMCNEIFANGFTKVVEGDGSAFDNTQDVALKEVDRYLYRRVADKVHHVPKQQFLHVSQQLKKCMNVKYIKNKKQHTMMRYEILGSVFSGDCDTTLCNTLRMALYNLYVNEKAGLKYGKDYIVISKGDDFTVFYKPYISNEFIRNIYYKYFLKSANEYEVYGLGQVLKMLVFGPPKSLSFCSLRAFPINLQQDQIILVRNPHKFLSLSKYSRTIKSMSIKQRVEYLIQQAVSLRVAYPNIEVYENMANAYELQARKLISNDNIVYNKLENKVYQNIREIRKKIEELDPKYLETPEYQMMYGIQFKKKFIKIKDNYWDTMKLLQETDVSKLSTEQLQYVNQEIENEISNEYFKSTMGLNKPNVLKLQYNVKF
jgi:hypothetical protein